MVGLIESVPEAPGPTGPSVSARRLALHALVLACALVLLIPIVGRGGLFSADEGAALAQSELLRTGEGWGGPHPFPTVDPDGVHHPLHWAEPAAGGGWAPFAKHPAYPVILAGAQRLPGPHGEVGAVLVSILGTVLAAIGAGLLARRWRPPLAVPVLWITGVGSPLLFGAYVVIAHTLGAALAIGSVLALLRYLDRGRVRWLLAGVGALAAAVLLRNEAALFGLALAGAVGSCAVVGRDARRAMAAVGAAVAVVAGWSLDTVLHGLVTDAATRGVAVTGGGSSWLADRLEGAGVTLLLPSYDGVGVADLLGGIGLVAAVVAAVVWVRRPGDVQGLAIWSTVAAAGTLGRLIAEPTAPVAGLAMAMPALAAGLAALAAGRASAVPKADRWIVAAVALFAVAVLSTQYAEGGAGEWGWRFVHLSLPVAVPLAAIGVGGAHRPERVVPRLVAACWVVVLVVPMLGMLATLHAVRERSDRLVTATMTTAEALAGPSPVIVTTSDALPRLAWRQLDEGRWLRSTSVGLPDLLDRLAARRVARAVLVTRDPARDLPAVGLPPDTGAELLAGSTWRIVALEP